MSDRRFMQCLLGSYFAISLFLFNYHSFPNVSDSDAISNMRRASGPLFHLSAFHGPGFPWAIRMVAGLGVPLFPAAKIASICFGAIFLTAAWKLIGSWADPIETRLAMFLLLLNPFFLDRSIVPMGDMAAAALFLAALTLIVVPRTVTPYHFAAAGALLGLSYLSRYIYLIGLGLPLLAWLFSSHETGGRKRTLTNWISFYSLLILVPLPWLLFLYSETGNPFWNKLYMNVPYKMYVKDTLGRPGMGTLPKYDGMLDVFASDPVLFVKSWLGTLIQLPWRLCELFPKIGLIASLGCFCWITKINRTKIQYLVVASVYGAAVSLVWLSFRYLLIFLPLIAAFIASGLMAIPTRIIVDDIPEFLSRICRSIPLRRGAIALTIFVAVVASTKTLVHHLGDQAPEYQGAIQRIGQLAGEQGPVMAARPHISYFAGLQYIGFTKAKLPFAELDELPNILSRHKPKFFVYDERIGVELCPKFRSLLDPETNPFPNVLRPVFVEDSSPRLVVYEVLPQ